MDISSQRNLTNFQWYRLPFPPSGQHRVVVTYRGGFLTKKAREYYEQVRKIVRENRKIYFDNYVEVWLNFLFPDKRKRDLDNLTKTVLDSLTRGNAWDDDSQVIRLHTQKCLVPTSKKNPDRGAVEVFIKSTEPVFQADKADDEQSTVKAAESSNSGS